MAYMFMTGQTYSMYLREDMEPHMKNTNDLDGCFGSARTTGFLSHLISESEFEKKNGFGI